MSTVESYLRPSIRRQSPAAPEQSAASRTQTSADTVLIEVEAHVEVHADIDIEGEVRSDIDLDFAAETTPELGVEVAAVSDHRIHRIHWAPVHRVATLASLALCAAALWGLAWQNAQIARLNLADSRLLTQVGVTQSANLGLHNEVTRLTNTTRVLRVAKQLHLHPAVVVKVPVHS